MADPFNSEIDVGPPPVTLRRGKPMRTIVTLVFLLIVAAGAGFVWLNYDRLMSTSHALMEGGQDAGAPVGALESAVSAKDFEAFQQQTATSLQSATDALAAQQTELKRLSDQIAALTSKIDLLQSSGPAPSPTAPRTTAAPPRPVAATVPPRRKPPVPKPAGAISVGGAPLPVQPNR